MTVYEFLCPHCGTSFDRIYPMGEAPRELNCIENTCHESAARVIAKPNIHIPGGTKAGYVRR